MPDAPPSFPLGTWKAQVPERLLAAATQLRSWIDTARAHAVQALVLMGVEWTIRIGICLVMLSFLASAVQAQQEQRERMVHGQIERRGITDEAVLEAMRQVPRHDFVPVQLANRAYEDRPLPIGYGQTISQPYIVAYMTALAQLDPDDRVLEVGTGSGYQAAVLAEIAGQVYTVEIVPELAAAAAERLARLGYDNVAVTNADGYDGWKKHAPYDVIVVTAAAEYIPPPLVQQLKDGGRMVIPVGSPFYTQTLMLVEKQGDGVKTRSLIPVRFVPFTRSDQ